MNFTPIGKIAGVLALTIGLAGCVDMTQDILITSDTTAKATVTTTMIWPRLELTVVFGSVTMKKMNSWYIGPVIGATVASHGLPVMALHWSSSVTPSVASARWTPTAAAS